MASLWNCVLILHVALLPLTNGQQPIANVQLINNKYTEILVGIAPDCSGQPPSRQEAQRIIDNIKEYFTEFSASLLIATKHRAYLGNVTIVVPKDWPQLDTPYEEAGGATYENAHVLIESPNAQYGDMPYVQQRGGCGEYGDHIYLTSQYVTDRNMAQSIGPIGNVLTQQWAKLRWGVFDEYVSPTLASQRQYQPFYHDANGDIQATKCPSSLTGDRRYKESDGSWRDCMIDEDTNLPEEGCQFIPDDDNQPETSASLMFWSAAQLFCDDTPDRPETNHNSEAPNMQNAKCTDAKGRGRSMWSVMRDHRDFASGNNPTDTTITDITPSFKVVQAGARYIVLILDVSPSMNDNNKLERQATSSEIFLRNSQVNCHHVGLVEFYYRSRVLRDLTPITSGSDVESLVDAIPRRTISATCIGCGLEKGLEVLNGKVGTLLVITDGEENREPFVDDVTIPDGIIVDAILYGTDPNNPLARLARRTGGQVYYDDSSLSSTGLTASLVNLIQLRGCDIQSDSSTLVLESFFLQLGGYKVMEFYVDRTTNQGLQVHISSTNNVNIQFSLENSEGETISEGNALVISSSAGSGFTNWLVSVNNNFGLWTLTVHHTGSFVDETYEVVVTGLSSKDDCDNPPISLTAEVTIIGPSGDALQSLDFNNGTATVRVTSVVKQGGTVVLEATVEAEVTYTGNNNRTTMTLTLNDNGFNGDQVAMDGIYSSYFTGFQGDGEYTMQVKANKPGVADDTGWQRQSPGGFITVVNQPANRTDLYPPSRVEDLFVTLTSFTESTMVLTWTAVGDDLFTGAASRYELRLNDGLEQLRSDFEGQAMVLQEDLLTGNLNQPAEPGTVEVFTIKLPPQKTAYTLFVGLIVYDDENNPSKLSNIATASLQPPKTNAAHRVSVPFMSQVLGSLTMILSYIIIY